MTNIRQTGEVPRPRGFTLIELLVTLVVLGILLSLAVPSFGRLIAQNRMATQTNEIVAGLNLARLEAVRRGQNIAIRANSGTLTFEAGWQIFTDSNGDGARGDSTSVSDNTDGFLIRESGTLAGNTTVHRATSAYADVGTSVTDRMYVVFNSRGANNSGAKAFFKVCDSGNTSVPGRIVQVSAVGKISLDSSTATCP
ncbi:MAG: GspH/FimT family pseudopilin [Rhizobacter sp.]